MNLFDTHVHLDDEQFDANRDDVVAAARQAGVTRLLTVGISAATSQRSVELARRYPEVCAAVGIQPNYAGQAVSGEWERVVALADDPAVVALGETGLDKYWDFTPFGVQQDYFDRHLTLAQQREMPFIVHMRDCEDETLDMLEAAHRRGPLRGVLHSFSGSAAAMRRCVELGLHVSFAGMVTFKKADALRAIAADVPDERILIETDAPYLAPAPHRGKRPNQPAWIVHTAQCLADVRGMSLDQFATQTTANANALFGQTNTM